MDTTTANQSVTFFITCWLLYQESMLQEQHRDWPIPEQPRPSLIPHQWLVIILSCSAGNRGSSTSTHSLWVAEQMWRLQQMCNVLLSISRHDEWLSEWRMDAASVLILPSFLCSLCKCAFLSSVCLYSFNPEPPSLLHQRSILTSSDRHQQTRPPISQPERLKWNIINNPAYWNLLSAVSLSLFNKRLVTVFPI